MSFKIDKYRNYWVLINAFWIRLRFVKYRFVRYRFVRYWFRFVSRPWLDTDISSKYFFCLQDVFITTWRHVFETSRLQDISSISLQNMSARCLHNNLKACLQDVFSITTFRPPRHFGDQQIFSGLVLMNLLLIGTFY